MRYGLENLRKEVTKAGKWYFYDNGIRNAIIGNFSPLSTRNDTGALWENYLIGELIKRNYNLGLGQEFFFWRTYDGQQIDLIVESQGSLFAYEFKWGEKKSKVPVAFSGAYPNASYEIINQENYLGSIGV